MLQIEECNLQQEENTDDNNQENNDGPPIPPNTLPPDSEEEHSVVSSAFEDGDIRQPLTSSPKDSVIEPEASTEVIHEEIKITRHTFMKNKDDKRNVSVDEHISTEDMEEPEHIESKRRSSFLADEEDDDLEGSITESESSVDLTYQNNGHTGLKFKPATQPMNLSVETEI